MPASPPGTLSGSSQGAFALYLSWIPVIPINLNGELNFYEIDITEVETKRNFQTTELSTSTSFGSLHPYFEYSCRVAAVTIGRGPYTPYVHIRTNESGEFKCVCVYMFC